ncbi:MAG TPA: L-aspartate oxidase [Roseiflexaceae bacterium]|nr:L-aspartate oxidase [Roseiflexaceae bacterium]
MLLHNIQVAAPRFVLTKQPENVHDHVADVLIIGGGAAGLAAALEAAGHANVTLLTRGPLPVSNSAWAQGGVAAAIDADDSPALHIEDTLIAGAGLSDREPVAALAGEAPALMRLLAGSGVPFERDDHGFVLGLEGGHSHRRILHTGDATGWAITSALIEQARNHPRIHIMEGFQAVDLLGATGQCAGVLARDEAGAWHCFHARATILATGGAGALYGLTSNQSFALGEGIALAYRAGAEVADMEFVQFHPTVFRTRAGQGFLISEAARGEGGRLLSVDGERFMLAEDPRAELAPRDIVARGIFAAMRRTSSDYVLLDLTHLPLALLEGRFPTIMARCRAEGIDPAREPIPVAPAAHYLMGGIRTDTRGATNIAGLYAVGECACTGVHGANRLASNSLLECLVFGRRAGAAAVELQIAHCTLQIDKQHQPNLQSTICNLQLDWRATMAQIMRGHAGLQRSAASLEAALQMLAAWPLQASATDAEAITAANAALAARLIVTGALLREESRGAHFRTDFPQSDEAWRVHIVQQRDAAPHTASSVGDVVSHAA